jgi:transporter family-2 protein
VLETPSWYWVGGLLGALYIAAAVVLAPRLGATTMIASVVAGQMLASLVLDHFGWVGFAEHHATPSRLAGVILVVAGVLLVRR